MTDAVPAPIAVVLLVDRHGSLLLQLRDAAAPRHPYLWGLPGGHLEPGESPEQAAHRELWEEAGLRPDDGLALFAVQDLPADGRRKHYFSGATRARQDDVVLGEGAAMVFVAAEELFDGRRYTPGTAEMLERFLAPDRYAELSAG